METKSNYNTNTEIGLSEARDNEIVNLKDEIISLEVMLRISERIGDEVLGEVTMKLLSDRYNYISAFERLKAMES